jgi:hypothetical protein
VVLGWLLGVALLCGFLHLEERAAYVWRWVSDPSPLCWRATRAGAVAVSVAGLVALALLLRGPGVLHVSDLWVDNYRRGCGGKLDARR